MALAAHKKGSHNRVAAALSLASLAAITLGVFLTWFHTPLSGDSKIFFAAARQADYHGAFPFNVYRSWELKPLGHRVMIYGLYKAATVFSDFQDKEAFERAARTIYAAVVFLWTLLFVYSMRHFLRGADLSPPLVFLGALLIFFSTSYLITHQAEEMSLLLIMASLPLALARSRALNVLSGLPLAALFTLKGVTVLLTVHVLILLYSLGRDYRRNLVWCGVGAAAWFALIMAIFVVVFPQELRDLRNATLFQGSLEFDLKRVMHLVWAFWHKFQFAPVLVPAVMLGWLSLPLWVWHRRWQDLGVLTAATAVSAVVVLAQDLYFGYHYAVFVVPALFVLFMAYRSSWGLVLFTTNKRMGFLTGWTLGLVCFLGLMTYLDRSTTDVVPLRVIGYNLAALLAAFLVLLGWLMARSRLRVLPGWHRLALTGLVIAFAGIFWIRYQSLWTLYPDYGRASGVERRVFGELDQRYRLSAQKELLYLSDDGIYTYYFGAPTHCRYFTMEPLNRVRGVGAKELPQSRVHQETLECVLSYKGEYILLGWGWGFLKQFPEVAEKIASEYELVTESGTPGVGVYRNRQGLTR